MIRVLYTVGFAALMTGIVGCAESWEAPDPQRAAEVASFKPEQPERWTLKNGLTVLYMKDDELPLVTGKLFVRGGSLWAQDVPTGSVSAMGDQMRQGGAGNLSADALDMELEKLAAAVTSTMSTEFGAVAFSSLSSDLDQVFPIFADVVLRPRFENPRLMLWKGQSLESIRRRKEDPSTVASVAFLQLLYGNTPYGKVAVERDITGIGRDTLVRLHERFLRPDGAILVVTGRVERAHVEKLVERYFGSWKARGSNLPAPPPVNYQPKPGVYFITLPFAQATVQLGQLGVPRLTPDYPEIDMFNEVFGSSGFGSRLMERVRTELGLSYGIYGGITPGVVKGMNYVFLQTKAQSVHAAIDESIGVLQSLQKTPPSESELDEKKAAVRNSYVFNFDTPADVAGRQARLELLKYPADYDQTYLPKIDAVTPQGVEEVAQNRWDPSQFVVVVVGNESAYAALSQAMQAKTGTLAAFDLKKLGFESAIVGQ